MKATWTQEKARNAQELTQAVGRSLGFKVGGGGRLRNS